MKKTLSLVLCSLGLLMFALQGEAQADFDNNNPILVATTMVNALPVKVATSCNNGTAIFKVTNVGAKKFPSAIEFNIIEVGDNKLFSKRRMNLGSGQTATFRLKNADKVSGDVGLFMDALWFPRDRQIDASVRCSD